MTRSCSESWRIEAAHDGRLDPQLLILHNEHCDRCDVCRDERRSIEALARGLREVSSAPDEVTMRRLRQLVLHRAGVQQHSKRPFQARIALWSAAFVLCVAAASGGAIVHYFHTRGVQTRPVPAWVQLEGNATKWVSHSSGDVERIDLTDGVLKFVVRRQPGYPRLLVHVPDGEIEDEGTTFRVSVQHGHTSEISVSDGWVRFRRPEQPDIVLPAGTTWTPEPTTRQEPAIVGPSIEVFHTIEPSVAATNKTPGTSHRARSSRSRDRRAQPAQEAAPDEDRAYLELLALVRLGHHSEARSAARVYLMHFPNAFRRAEIERLAAFKEE